MNLHVPQILAANGEGEEGDGDSARIGGTYVLSETSTKLGNAVAIPTISWSVKQKVHPPVVGKVVAARPRPTHRIV